SDPQRTFVAPRRVFSESSRRIAPRTNGGPATGTIINRPGLFPRMNEDRADDRARLRAADTNDSARRRARRGGKSGNRVIGMERSCEWHGVLCIFANIDVPFQPYVSLSRLSAVDSPRPQRVVSPPVTWTR